MSLSNESLKNCQRQKVRPYGKALLFLSVIVFGFSSWANFSWVIRNPLYLRYVPPFQAGIDANDNIALGGEYFSIAQAITDGRGFSDPFKVKSGPTAWMPPMLCWIEAFFLWIFKGDRELVMVAMVMMQNIALICTVWMMFELLGSTARALISFVVLVELWFQFRFAFQVTSDGGFLMLVMDGVMAGYCFYKPFSSLTRSFTWGIFGGLACLSSPIVGFVWGVLGLFLSTRQKRCFVYLCSLLTMSIIVLPWTVRNYAVFGRVVPVKSNLAYELYQTQVLQEQGVLDPAVLFEHPGCLGSEANWEYLELGESEFLAQTMDRFLEAVRKDPLQFFRKVWERFLGATIIYHPIDRYFKPIGFMGAASYMLLYCLPFIAWIVLVALGFRRRLSDIEMVLVVGYIFYFLPYILISFYLRYEFPANPIKWILIAWLMHGIGVKGSSIGKVLWSRVRTLFFAPIIGRPQHF